MPMIYQIHNVKIKCLKSTRESIESVIGQKVSDSEIAGLVGAIDNSTVEISEYANNTFLAQIKHKYILEQVRIFGKANSGVLYLKNEVFQTHPDSPKKIGLVSLAREIHQAKKLDFAYIRTFASGKTGDENIGYYVWARFGFNAPLTAKEKAKLPDMLKTANDLNDLFLLGGKFWWWQNGTGRDMIFELDESKTSYQIWQAYLQEKGVL
jgi:hypothetical protein